MPVSETTARPGPVDRMSLTEAQSDLLDSLIGRLDADTLHEVVSEQFHTPVYARLLTALRTQDVHMVGASLLALVTDYLATIHAARLDELALPIVKGGEYGVEKFLDDRDRARACNEVLSR